MVTVLVGAGGIAPPKKKTFCSLHLVSGSKDTGLRCHLTWFSTLHLHALSVSIGL